MKPLFTEKEKFLYAKGFYTGVKVAAIVFIVVIGLTVLAIEIIK